MKDKHHEPKQAKQGEIEEHEEVRETKPIVWTDEMYHLHKIETQNAFYLDKIETQSTMIELLKERVALLEEQLKDK
jgi:hypothetical protein